MTQRTKKCPSSAALNRAFSDRADGDIERHLRECEACALSWSTKERIIETARTLPTLTLSTEQKEQVRAGLVMRARDVVVEQKMPSRRHAIWALVATASVAAALVAVSLWPNTESEPAIENTSIGPRYRATLHEHAGARFVRIGEQPDEIVRLYDGSITVEVEHLDPGERFRVLTGDAEVEVHGTAFDVRAEGDRLDLVRVLRGTVEVRAGRTPPRILGPNENWQLPPMAEQHDDDTRPSGVDGVQLSNVSVQVAADPPATEPHHGRSAAHATAPAKSTNRGFGHATPSDAELAFQEGWSALRAGNPARAAGSFARVGVGSSVSEDAAYWYAVATVRAGRRVEGSAAFEEFLERYPQSSRFGEAAVALGWLLYNRGERASAAARFASAENDQDERVRASALRGLEQVGRQ